MELPKSDHELKALCASCLAPECLGRDKHKMNASVCGWHQPVTLAHIAPLESMRSRLCAALGLPADSAPETVAEAAEARRVVVPELTEETLVRAGGPYCINDREPFQRGARWAVEFVREHSRAIPADRVLGEGMVEELRLLRDALVELCDSQLSSRDREGAIARGLAALRANQGGLNHVHV